MGTDFLEENVITYSPSFTLPVTHACANRCLYCGFRKMDGGLMGMEEVDSWLDRSKGTQCSEVLVISGERVNDLGSIQEELCRLGFGSFVDYAVAVGQRILQRGKIGRAHV